MSATAIVPDIQAPPLEEFSLGELAEKLREIQLKKRELNAEIKQLDKTAAMIEPVVLQKMDELGVTATKTGNAAIAISENEVPIISGEAERGWSELFEHIQATNSFHLLQRRLSLTACQELHKLGQLPPMLKMLTKRSVNVRKG